MGKVTGFLEIDRQEQRYEPASDRIRHFGEFTIPLGGGRGPHQAARCMDCGIPFCHGRHRLPGQQPDPGLERPRLSRATGKRPRATSTPPTTSPSSPAASAPPLRGGLHAEPRGRPRRHQDDRAGHRRPRLPGGWVKPQPPSHKTGKRVAIVGSGPAGMAAAQQLARAGHDVHVYEREPKAGGLLRYGIPDFKMEKHYIDFRVAQMEAEGVIFHFGENIGVDTTPLGPRRRPRRGAAGRRRRAPARSAAPRQRARGRPLRHALPRPAEPPRRRRGRLRGEPDPRRRQACRRHRRRRHRVRLRRHRLPPGRHLRHPARHPPHAAGARGQADHLAQLGDQDAHLLEPGRGRQPRVLRRHASAWRAATAASGVQCARVDEKRQPIAGTEFS